MKLAGRIAGQSGMLLAGFGLAQALSFGRNAILGHWLSKGDFGIAASITLVLQTIEILSDLGADRLLVQHKDSDDRRLMSTLHATLLMRGVATAVVLALAAWPAASFFHVEQAWPAFAATALVPLAKGFVHLDYRRRQRDLDNHDFLAVEVWPQIAAFVALVPVLLIEPGYRAVVAVAVIQAATMIVASHVVAQRRFEVGLDRDVLRRILAYGWPIWLSAFPLIAVYHGDRALVGRMLGMDLLAGYSAAFMLTMVPGLLAAKGGNAGLLPLLARARAEPLELARRFRLMVEITTITAALYAVGFIVCGEIALKLAFGWRYTGLDAVSALLATMWAVRMVQAVPGMALMAHEHTRPFLIAGLVRAAGLPMAAAAIYNGHGLEGVAAAGIAAEVCSLLVMCGSLDRVAGGLGRSCLLRSIVLVPTIAATVWLARLAEAGGHGPWLDFGLLVCVCVVLAPALAISMPDVRREAFGLFNARLVRRTPSAAQA